MVHRKASSSPAVSDTRPSTAVWHDEFGIGDLIWHLPFFEKIAEQSRGGRVTVIASPTTCANQLLAHEPWVERVVAFERRALRGGQRTATHTGWQGMRQFARELRTLHLDRIVIFSKSATLASVAWLARIPQRVGYGFDTGQRCWLNQPPYIHPYEGKAVPIFHEVAALSMAHGFCSQPLPPRVRVPEVLVEQARARLADLPRPLFALVIGTSDPIKQWGGLRYMQLARLLMEAGGSVLILGGPGEESLALDIQHCLPESLHARIRVWCRETLMGSAAALRVCDASIGNDTGAANLAAACERPSYVVLGPRPPLDHDPLMRMLRASSLEAIRPEHIAERLRQDGLLPVG
jgi:heptosyltransferase-2